MSQRYEKPYLKWWNTNGQLMKKCAGSLDFEEIQIKPMLSNHLTSLSSEWAYPQNKNKILLIRCRE